ncbi:MFS general substrate transporter [Fomitopsis serialis]|uniref:MFS general substrate transporter n=1 Tax=Fomitopsis serialis TaxID=139415 RepID=UPI002008B1E4|nr:MFS general substrate transporter [Neoantrodia serialis]KAH9930639.1 MFS general substrate transporter [Neoantrodia serialis]
MSSSDASIEKEKRGADHEVAESYDVDVAAQLVAGSDGPVDPAEANRVKRKIDLHILPLMCLLYLMQFADKTTLGQSAVLGILKDAHLGQNQFDWLSTIFYLSFLAFQLPQSYALQRLPVGKWVSVNILVWSIALLCHAAAKSFGTLLVCRFFLGMAEGAITPGFMIVTSMFYTRTEQTRRVGYWFLMNGTAVIFLGLVAYGTLHISHGALDPWQWLMIITGLITFVTAILFWFFFPDSPATARFLTHAEKGVAVARIKTNQAGVENKHFKREQVLEVFKDPKTYLFFFFAAISNVTNSLSNQRQIIVAEFGFSAIDTTLLGCVDGLFEIIWIFVGTMGASYWPHGRAYMCALHYLVAILGAILVTTLPWSDKVGLLFSYWIAINYIVPFVIFLSWVGNLTAGHTKRVTTNAIVMVGYAVGNAVGPQYWQARYDPRNRVPWAILAACWAASMLIILATRFYLARENGRREREPRDATYDEVYIVDEKGEEQRVDRAFLDLTDMQNRDFRYVL